VLATDGPIRVEVVATAKRDLKAGEVIDGLGGFMTYGECENVWVSGPEDLLPMGVAEGCRLVRDVPKDTDDPPRRRHAAGRPADRSAQGGAGRRLPRTGLLNIPDDGTLKNVTALSRPDRKKAPDFDYDIRWGQIFLGVFQP
jgi:hypothetical protein